MGSEVGFENEDGSVARDPPPPPERPNVRAQDSLSPTPSFVRSPSPEAPISAHGANVSGVEPPGNRELGRGGETPPPLRRSGRASQPPLYLRD